MTLGTVIVGAIVAAAFLLALIIILKDRKEGRGSCSGCSGCAMKDSCHKKEKDNHMAGDCR